MIWTVTVIVIVDHSCIMLYVYKRLLEVVILVTDTLTTGPWVVLHTDVESSGMCNLPQKWLACYAGCLKTTGHPTKKCLDFFAFRRSGVANSSQVSTFVALAGASSNYD